MNQKKVFRFWIDSHKTLANHKVIQPQLRQSSRRIAARKAETPDFTQGDKEAFEIAAAERDRETELLFAKQREEHARKKT